MDAIHEARIARLQQTMAAKDVDALLILTAADYVYFIGDLRRQPRAIIPREGRPILLAFAPEVEEAQLATGLADVRPYSAMHEMMVAIMGYFKSLGKERPKVAVEMEFATPAFLLERFKLANPRVQLVDSKPLVSPLRQIKAPEEVALIAKAAELADLGIERARQVIGAGVTEAEVALEVEYAVRKAGADRLGFPMFVNSGPRSLWLHGMATDKRIEPGDLVIVDIGPVYRGYNADICRTFSVGEPSEQARELYGLYREMQAVALAAARPGVALHQVEAQTEQVLARGGHKERYLRGLMHGVGLGFEETPFPTIFPEDILLPLQTGMVLAVGHTTLAVPGIGGVRVEDTVHLTESGPVYLTHAPRETIITV
ncbi:MAG TPA: Xaa-Pro peptidase family protein [Anaerolineae bacterium]|nr:Xaa-Pro peptidase family protein [Anaerolineae bacterium]HPL27107.1 Xaa-Pro peptidase family protein [Anaerolineae bacterium]